MNIKLNEFYYHTQLHEIFKIIQIDTSTNMVLGTSNRGRCWCLISNLIKPTDKQLAKLL